MSLSKTREIKKNGPEHHRYQRTFQKTSGQKIMDFTYVVTFVNHGKNIDVHLRVRLHDSVPPHQHSETKNGGKVARKTIFLTFKIVNSIQVDIHVYSSVKNMFFRQSPPNVSHFFSKPSKHLNLLGLMWLSIKVFFLLTSYVLRCLY